MSCCINQSFSSSDISSPFEDISSKTDKTHPVIAGHQTNQIQLSRNICIYFIEQSIVSIYYIQLFAFYGRLSDLIRIGKSLDTIVETLSLWTQNEKKKT